MSSLTLTLKVDRPYPCNYPHMPTDYRHTDKYFRLVMTLLSSTLAVLLFAYRQTNGRTDGCYQVHYLRASRLIKIGHQFLSHTITDLGGGRRKFSKFIFFRKRAFEFFFLDFLWPHPQIINGRPLSSNEPLLTFSKRKTKNQFQTIFS